MQILLERGVALTYSSIRYFNNDYSLSVLSGNLISHCWPRAGQRNAQVLFTLFRFIEVFKKWKICDVAFETVDYA